MNCYKCGKEMRVVPEQVATDEKRIAGISQNRLL